ncbi:MAG TPA: hypothetical protein PKA88_05745 [Polyangiaceae bacterium]|nr:hypothetical protein [Polyangiaceae bacterium]
MGFWKPTCPHDVRIELENPGASYAPGDAIRGRVTIRTASHDHCEALGVGIHAFTKGRGDDYRAVLDKQRLFEGQWVAGQVYSYGFP